jgi:hypothetical protein
MVKGAVVVRRIGRPAPLAVVGHGVEHDVDHGVGVARAIESVTRRAHGNVTVEVVPPDTTRPILAVCPVCRRPVLYGEMTGWATAMCRHCKLVLRIIVAAASDLP